MSKPQAMLYQNTQYSRVMSLKFKAKYKKLKRQIKSYIIDNAALCDEVSAVQAELNFARDERRFLIQRLMRYEGGTTGGGAGEDNQTGQGETKTNAESAGTKTPKDSQGAKKRGPKKRATTKNLLDKTEKGRTRDSITLDNNGKPMLPINLYNILIHSPGEIIPVNPNFHAAHWIYPVGYVATRIYAHPKDPQRKCVFTCKILNNAGMPQFQIIPDSDLDSVFFGESANVCHQGLLETMQRSLTDVVKLPMNVQGEKFFGLANTTVRALLQLDAGYKQCANFKGFETDDTSFAIGEDKDPTMNYDALQELIAVSAYHTMPEVKEEPPDELLSLN